MVIYTVDVSIGVRHPVVIYTVDVSVGVRHSVVICIVDVPIGVRFPCGHLLSATWSVMYLFSSFHLFLKKNGAFFDEGWKLHLHIDILKYWEYN